MPCVSAPPALLRIASLASQGASRREISSAIRGMDRLAVGLYAHTQGLTGPQLLALRAAALSTRVSDAVVSHHTAAALWGLPARTRDLEMVHLSALAGRAGHAKSGPGYRFHRREIPLDAVAELHGIPVTDPIRTVLDVARARDMDWAVVIADAALHQGLVALPALTSAAAVMTASWGAARARALPGLCSPLAESPGESLLRLRLQRMGLAMTEQVVLDDVEGAPRVDFLVEGRLVVEFDGEAKYAMSGDVARAHWLEKQRHDRIVEQGYPVRRVIWAHLWDEVALAARMHRALRAP
jgi:very-short-patch-repair endonuclease